MYYRKIIVLFVFTAFLSSISCNLINPSEPIPSYVSVNAMKVTSNVNFGSNSSKIKDVWVYADGEYIGTFQLPAKFPVLKNGKHSFLIGAGIFKNGIDATRVKYPFYDYYSAELDLTPGQTLALDTLTVPYYSGITVDADDFEGAGFRLDTLNTSLADLAIDTVNPYEGLKSLKMQVGTVDSILECASNNYYSLPGGKESYFEMNYRADVKFYVGFVYQTPTYTAKTIIIQINPSEEWNKIYIDLGPTVLSLGTAFGFKTYFLVKLDPTATQNTVYIDNLKVIHN